MPRPLPLRRTRPPSLNIRRQAPTDLPSSVSSANTAGREEAPTVDAALELLATHLTRQAAQPQLAVDPDNNAVLVVAKETGKCRRQRLALAQVSASPYRGSRGVVYDDLPFSAPPACDSTSCVYPTKVSGHQRQQIASCQRVDLLTMARRHS